MANISSSSGSASQGAVRGVRTNILSRAAAGLSGAVSTKVRGAVKGVRNIAGAVVSAPGAIKNRFSRTLAAATEASKAPATATSSSALSSSTPAPASATASEVTAPVAGPGRARRFLGMFSRATQAPASSSSASSAPANVAPPVQLADIKLSGGKKKVAKDLQPIQTSLNNLAQAYRVGGSSAEVRVQRTKLVNIAVQQLQSKLLTMQHADAAAIITGIRDFVFALVDFNPETENVIIDNIASRVREALMGEVSMRAIVDVVNPSESEESDEDIAQNFLCLDLSSTGGFEVEDTHVEVLVSSSASSSSSSSSSSSASTVVDQNDFKTNL